MSTNFDSLKTLLDSLDSGPASTVLATTHPTDVRESSICAWFKTTKLSAEKRRRANTASEHYKSLCIRVNGPTLDKLRAMTIKYGLPHTKSTKLTAKSAVDIIVLATYLME